MPADALVTTVSLQALDLVNEALLESGDTVVLEGWNYGGALSCGPERLLSPKNEHIHASVEI